MWDKLACIRSIVSVDEHSDSLVMTGKSERENRTANHPSFGSVVSRVARPSTATCPRFVSLRGMSRGTEPGFLGIAHRPFSPSGPGVENLRPLARRHAGAHERSPRRCCEGFDGVRRDLDASVAGLDAFTTRAFDMVASGGVRNALDLTREPANSASATSGVEQFLTARRLVEAGVGCVTLSIGGWDTHGQNFQQPAPPAARGRSRRRQPGPGPARPRPAQRRGRRDVGRVRPHAAHQQQRRPRSLVAGHVGDGRRRRPAHGPGDRRQRRPAANGRRTAASPCRRCCATLYRAIGIDPAARPSPTAPAGPCTSWTTASRCASWCKPSVVRGPWSVVENTAMPIFDHWTTEPRTQ